MTIQLAQTNCRVKIRSAGLILTLIVGVCVIPQEAAGYIIQGAQSGFGSGFEHPLTGADHFLAMFAVGLWGAQMGGRPVWTLPVTFPLIMVVGGVAGMAGIPAMALPRLMSHRGPISLQLKRLPT